MKRPSDTRKSQLVDADFGERLRRDAAQLPQADPGFSNEIAARLRRERRESRPEALRFAPLLVAAAALVLAVALSLWLRDGRRAQRQPENEQVARKDPGAPAASESAGFVGVTGPDSGVVARMTDRLPQPLLGAFDETLLRDEARHILKDSSRLANGILGDLPTPLRIFAPVMTLLPREG